MSTKPIAINADPDEPEYSAVETRRSLSMLLTHGVGDGLGARAGVRPGGGDAVSLSGSTINVAARPVVVYPGESSTDGPYIGHLVTDSHSLTPADGSNPRVDIVVMRVYDDDHDSSGRRELVTEYLPGTPDPSPVAPATPAGATLLATISVPAGGSPAPTLTYVAPFTVASGGVLPVRDSSERPTAGLYDGMVVWDQAAGEALARHDGLWVPPQRGWNHIASGTADDVTNFTVDITDGGRFPAGTFEMIRLHVKGRTSGLTNVTTRINGLATADLHQTSSIAWDASDAGAVFTDHTQSGVIGTTALLGRWSTSLRMNSIEATFHNTGVASRCDYQSDAVRQPTNAGNFATFMKAWGSLQEDRLMDSLQIRTANLAEDFLLVAWWVEGYRV